MTWTAVSMCQPQPGPENIQLDVRRKAPVGRFDHRLRRPRRVQIDRHVERFGTLQDRPVEFVVEIAAAIVAVDDRAFEALRELGAPAPRRLFPALRSATRQARQSASDFSSRRRQGSRWTLAPPRWLRPPRSCSVPGYCSDKTCMSMPAASISASRLAPMSARRLKKSASRPPDCCARSLKSRPGPSKNPGLAKCSSSVMVRMVVPCPAGA